MRVLQEGEKIINDRKSSQNSPLHVNLSIGCGVLVPRAVASKRIDSWRAKILVKSQGWNPGEPNCVLRSAQAEFFLILMTELK